MRDIILFFLAMAVQAGGDGGPTPAEAVAAAPTPVPVNVPAPGQASLRAPAQPAVAGLNVRPSRSALVAEDQAPTGRFTTATEVRPILEATRMAWIATRDWDGQQLVYVTHLWSWRCGLAQIEIGVNGSAPEIWPLPACHLDQAAPNVILDGDGLPYRAFPPGSLSRIEVRVTYDDLSIATAVYDGNGVLVE